MEDEVLIVQTDISEIGNRSATFRNRIVRESGEAVFESRWKSVLMDLDRRRAAPIPPALGDMLKKYQS